MTTPGHYNEVVLVGDIREVYTSEGGAVIGAILVVNADEPCEVPVMFPGAQTGIGVGDRVWARGRLASESMPNRLEALLFIQARWIALVSRRH
jgi:hypothetical protein